MNTLKTGIIGAGMSGLIAGVELQRAGHEVTVFESRSRTGGRIFSFRIEGFLLEAGPEFIHGNLMETIRLLKKYKIRYNSIGGKMYEARNGYLKESHEMNKGWDELFDKMKSLERDLTFDEFLRKYFSGDHYTELRKSAIRFAEGYDLANICEVSTKGLLMEWENEESDEQFRIEEGYGTLIRAIENEFKELGGKIFLQHAVQKVDWNLKEIQLNVEGNKNFTMDKLIVSVPLSLLNQEPASPESILFSPSLDTKKEAFRSIGSGSVIKIITIWNSVFWKHQAPGAHFIFSDEFIPTWWTQFPADIPMLTGWLGGPKVAMISNEPDSFILNKTMESLSSIFSISPEELKKNMRDYKIFNWENEPWSHGAYSFPKIGSDAAKIISKESVQGRIYFAGEAFYDGPYPGTVEAAAVDGLRVANDLLKGL